MPTNWKSLFKNPTLNFFSAPFACGPNFFHFRGGCFSFHTQSALTWNFALMECNRKGGTLAKVSREGLRSALSNKLEGMRPKPDNLHIGFFARDDWVWIDGNPLNASLWMPGYPSGYYGVQSCAVLSAISSRIKNVDCKTFKNALCFKRSGMSHSLNCQWNIWHKIANQSVIMLTFQEKPDLKTQRTLLKPIYETKWNLKRYSHFFFKYFLQLTGIREHV